MDRRIINHFLLFMQKRPIKKQENVLIRHLLAFIQGQTDFDLPQMVTDLDDGQMQSIRLTSNPGARYSGDLIQVKYLDDDNLVVLITLTVSDTNELFELHFRKVYADKLITYPAPDKVRGSVARKINF